MVDRTSERRLDEAQDSLYGVEHTLALVMALVCAVLAVLGTLVGLGVIELRDGMTPVAGDEASGFLNPSFWDGAMLLFSAIAAGLLAYTLHSNDHHRMRDLSRLRESERSMWGMEHMLAYLLALGAIIFVMIGLLTGFNALSANQDQADGLIWIWFGVAGATLTAALHAVGHHQTADEGFIIGIIEERVGMPDRAAGASSRTGLELR
jgi:hypothetical protein